SADINATVIAMDNDVLNDIKTTQTNDIWDKGSAPEIAKPVKTTKPKKAKTNRKKKGKGKSAKSNKDQDNITIVDVDTDEATNEVMEGEIVELEDIPSDLVNDDDRPDELVETDVDLDSIPHPLEKIRADQTIGDLRKIPGGGIGLTLPKFPPLTFPPRRGNKPGVMGQPRHQPTKQFRQRVFDAMASGYNQEMVATMLRISANTLRKYYDFEIEQAEAHKRYVQDSSLYLSALQGHIDPAFFPHTKLHYQLTGRLTEKVDVTSNGETMENPHFIVVPTVINNKITVNTDKGEIDPDIPED
ncbi:MAG: hypothetical protein K0U41_09735, partial [Gammaproteobacteria bacterium]|nr:hypothetical protein [Gammaproteobacteria bacterium]